MINTKQSKISQRKNNVSKKSSEEQIDQQVEYDLEDGEMPKKKQKLSVTKELSQDLSKLLIQNPILTKSQIIDFERIKLLNDKQCNKNGKFVLYWMQASVREQYNHALEYAIELANSNQIPLLVVFGLCEKYPEANQRHFAFLLEGLRDVKKLLQLRNIDLLVIREKPDILISKLSQDNVFCVVTDKGYLKIQKQWRDSIQKNSPVSVIEIESNVVVPILSASDKEEHAARTIRPKIQKNLKIFLKKIEKQKIQFPQNLDYFKLYIKDYKDLEILSDDVDQVLSMLQIDNQVERVKTFTGGYTEAFKQLQRFTMNSLKNYAKDNSQPCLSGKSTSNMSPYLHFGHISPIEIALEIQKQPNIVTENKDRYLEELIVRRELAINMCFFNENYDNYKIIPNYAKETLKIHEKDKREYIYSYEEFEAGLTHDEYWNAAQMEMVSSGKMQGYMRMYWGKKIIEWTEKPEQAFDICLKLNNKYELDGRDANGFTGVAWIFGKHDQGWTEREIFGKVRFMNEGGLKRKFDMYSYIEHSEKCVKNHGIPQFIKDLRQTKTKKQFSFNLKK